MIGPCFVESLLSFSCPFTGLGVLVESLLWLSIQAMVSSIWFIRFCSILCILTSLLAKVVLMGLSTLATAIVVVCSGVWYPLWFPSMNIAGKILCNWVYNLFDFNHLYMLPYTGLHRAKPTNPLLLKASSSLEQAACLILLLKVCESVTIVDTTTLTFTKYVLLSVNLCYE